MQVKFKKQVPIIMVSKLVGQKYFTCTLIPFLLSALQQCKVWYREIFNANIFRTRINFQERLTV